MDFQIWLQFGFAGIIAMLAGKVFDLLRDMTRRETASDKHDHEQARQAGQNVTALTVAIQSLAGSNQALMTYLDAQTSNIKALNKSTIEINDLMTGARREMQGVKPILDQIKAAVDGVPQGVRAALVDDFASVGNTLADCRDRVNEALQDWAKTGAALQRYLEEHPSGVRETPETKPVTGAAGDESADENKPQEA